LRLFLHDKKFLTFWLGRWSTGRFAQKADLVDISGILKVDDVEK
jgi:hypothetical protein